MSKFDAIICYKTSLSIFISWYRLGLISVAELNTLDTNLCEKYGIALSSIYRPNPLLYKECRQSNRVTKAQRKVSETV